MAEENTPKRKLSKKARRKFEEAETAITGAGFADTVGRLDIAHENLNIASREIAEGIE